MVRSRRRARARCRGPRRSTPRPTAIERARELHGAGVDRGARRRARHERGRVRVGAAREGRDRHRQRRRAARRRPARPRSCSACRAPRSPTATAPPRSCCSARTSKKSCRCCTCASRRAALELGVPLVDLAPVAHGLSQHATVVARPLPGEALGARTRSSAIAERAGRSPRTGRRRARPRRRSPSRRRASRAVAATLAGRPDVRFLSALRRGNVHGALDAGLAPGFLPGRVTLDAGPRVVHRARGAARPPRAGLDATGILRAAADGKIEVLVLLGADPLADFPDADARAARRSTARGIVIAVDAFLVRRRRDAPTCSCRARCGARRPARSPTSKAACSASAARSRPRARRWTTGASRSSSRSGSAPTSTSRPSTRSPTRSRASRPRSPASTAELLQRGARRRRAPAARAPRRDRAPHARAVDPGRRRLGHLVGPDQGRGRGRRRARGSTPTQDADADDADAAVAGRRPRRCPRSGNGTATSPNAEVPRARRVRSAPRGRPHALRRRARRQPRRRCSQRLVRRSRAARQPARPRRASASTRGDAGARSPRRAARTSVAVVRRSRACRPASRCIDFSADGAGAALLIDATPRSPTCAWRRLR